MKNNLDSYLINYKKITKFVSLQLFVLTKKRKFYYLDLKSKKNIIN